MSFWASTYFVMHMNSTLAWNEYKNSSQTIGGALSIFNDVFYMGNVNGFELTNSYENWDEILM